MSKRFVVATLVVTGAIFASAIWLGGCDESCVDTGCVEIEAGSDVKEAGKKDAAKEAATESGIDGATDATDATDATSDGAGDADTGADAGD